MKRKARRGLLFLAASFLFGSAPAETAERTTLTPAQICKAGIAVVMGRDHKTMRIDRTKADVIFLSYTRVSDRTRWAYKCKVEGQRILWGADDGRWRNHPADSVITFTIGASSVTVTERFEDGSSKKENFTVKQLGR